MAKSNAERQAAYRERLRQRRNVTTEEAVEAVRRKVAADFVKEADAPDHAARLRDVTAQPLWADGEFSSWLEGMLTRETEEQIRRTQRSRDRRVWSEAL